MDGVARPVSSGRTIPALLAARAAEWPEHGFIWLQDGEGRESRLDYGGLPGRVASIAAGLTERAGKGDRVLILLPPGLDYTLAVLATMAAGMIAVPVYPPDPANRMMGLAQVKAVVMDSAPSLGLTAIPVAGLVTAAGEIEPAIAALPWLHLDELEATHAGAVPNTDVSAGDVAVLLYTSGSTGAPKGVMLSHGNLADTAAAMAEDCRLDPAGRICAWLPGYHVSGLFGGIILPLWAGATVIGFAPRAFAERPIRWLEVISRYAVTFSGAPTFAYDVIARTIRPDDLAGIDLSHWATAVVGGEAIRPDVIAAFVRALAPAGFRREAIYTMFGQTEAAMITTGNGYLAGPRRLVLDPDSLREGRARDVADDRLGARELLSSGRALPGMAFAIVDSLTGIALADESVGEIWLAGPCVGLGYWGKPDDTRDIFQAFTAAREGPFLRSGDLGFRSGGEVFVVGRMKEVIILRGLKYYPDDLEATARAADERLSNAAAAAFGFEGPSGQEMLALAFEAVPIEDDAERQALASAIRRAVAASWAVQVSAIVFCAPGELPRTRTAKVQRTQCTSLLEKGAWHPVGGLLGVTGAAVAEAPQADLDALPLAEFADVLPGELARLFARRLGIRQDQMAPQHAIGDFGVDSMAVVQLGLDILNRFRVNLSAEDLRGEQTIAALSATILERRSKAAAKTSAGTQDRRLRSVILGLCRRVTRTEISDLNNLPARGPAILAVNHVNSLDAPLLAGILPQERPLLIASAHLAARAFTDRPLRALFRPIYIDMNLALSFISALEALQQGEIVGIAPEGRLAIDGVLGEAKHGAAYLAAVSGAPVIPIAISGHVGWKRRLLSLKPLAVRIAFGRPMRFSGTGAGDLARNTEAIMHEIAAMLPAPYRGRYATPAFTPARHEVA